MNLDGIRKARKQAGLTQEQLAEQLGINRATLSKYESGQIVPSLGQLGAIARALHTTVTDMIGSDWDGVDMSDAFSVPAADAPEQSRLRAALLAAVNAAPESELEAVRSFAMRFLSEAGRES